jgi:hypothetical protein
MISATGRRKWFLSALVLAAAFSVAASGLALANSRGHAAATRFYACVAQSGDIRIVGSSKPCRFSERKIWWNQLGPAGRDGVSGYEVVRIHTTVPPQPPCPPNALCAVQTVSAQAMCPTGKRPVSGGYELGGNNLNHLVVIGSHPADQTGSARAWVVILENNLTSTQPTDIAEAYVYAVCATA